MFKALDHALFGGLDPPERIEFAKAWEAASRQQKRLRIRKAKPADAAQQPPAESLQALCNNEKPPNPLLLKLAVEVPSQAGTANDFQPVVELRYGTERFADGKYDVVIGIGRLTLLPTPSCCEIRIGPRYADDGTVPGVRTNGNAWEFVATDGPVLSKPFIEAIARFVRGPATEAPQVRFRAFAHATDLRAVPGGEVATAPKLNKAIVEQYLLKKGYPKGGIIELGAGSVHWVAKL